MEVSLKSLTLFTAVFLTGLSAGCLRLAGIRNSGYPKGGGPHLPGKHAIHQPVILNPVLFPDLLGSPLALAISTIQQFNSGMGFWLLLAASIAYVLGTLA